MRFILLILLSSSIFATEYLYEEKTGDELEQVRVEIIEGVDGFTITNNSNRYYSEYTCNKGFELKEYKTLDKEQNKSVRFYREGNTIFDKYGKPVTKVKGEKELWFEDLTNLNFFISSKDKEMFMFVVGPAYKMDGTYKEGKYSRMDLKAVKEESEVLDINGTATNTVKVMLTTKNPVMSVFWKAYYWYRETDGILVYYEDTKGPGAPRTYGKLIN